MNLGKLCSWFSLDIDKISTIRLSDDRLKKQKKKMEKESTALVNQDFI